MAISGEEIRRIIDQAWEEGRRQGLTEKQITEVIESSLREKQTKKKYSYTPMTDEEVRRSQEKIFEEVQELYGPPPKVEEVVVEMPQMLYGPPPKVEEVVVEMPQILYGPPPREELHEMFIENNPDEKNNKKGNKR